MDTSGCITMHGGFFLYEYHETYFRYGLMADKIWNQRHRDRNPSLSLHLIITSNVHHVFFVIIIVNQTLLMYSCCYQALIYQSTNQDKEIFKGTKKPKDYNGFTMGLIGSLMLCDLFLNQNGFDLKEGHAPWMNSTSCYITIQCLPGGQLQRAQVTY